MSSAFDDAAARVAASLGLTVGRRFSGGEFGAVEVSDATGRRLVLKVMDDPALRVRFEQGARMAARARQRGSPAPRYMGTGVRDGYSWSLQELLPGEVPDEMTVAHAARLLELVRLHEGPATDEPAGARTDVLALLRGWIDELRDVDARIVPAAAGMLDRVGEVPLLEDSIVHGDFHHRNFLAEGDAVTGVFDWELAHAGDWRLDLVTLHFWTALMPGRVHPAAAALVAERTGALCPPECRALFSAYTALGTLAFYARERPATLPWFAQRVREAILPWWDEDGGPLAGS